MLTGWQWALRWQRRKIRSLLNVTSRYLLGPSYAVREELTGDTSHAVFSRVTNATPLSAHSDPTNINSFSTLQGGPKDSVLCQRLPELEVRAGSQFRSLSSERGSVNTQVPATVHVQRAGLETPGSLGTSRNFVYIWRVSCYCPQATTTAGALFTSQR